MFIPFENWFVTFPSVRSAYEYVNSGQSDIEVVIEGRDCDFVVDNKINSDRYLIVPKASDGWKIGIGADTNRVFQYVTDEAVVYVYQYKETDNYFVTIIDFNGGTLEMVDTGNSNFVSTKRIDSFTGDTIVTYYTYVSEFDLQYWLDITESKSLS